MLDFHYSVYSTHGNSVSNTEQIKQIFITYKGMLKILFSSRTGIADKFIDWATECICVLSIHSQHTLNTLSIHSQYTTLNFCVFVFFVVVFVTFFFLDATEIKNF